MGYATRRFHLFCLCVSRTAKVEAGADSDEILSVDRDSYTWKIDQVWGVYVTGRHGSHAQMDTDPINPIM